MIIETTEKFTKEEIDEVFAITLKRSQLYKTPDKPLKDPFKDAIGNIIWGGCAFVITFLLGLFLKFSPISIIAMTLSGVLLLIGILMLVVEKKAYKEAFALYEKQDHSKVEFDEEKIGVEMSNGTKVNIKWNEIEFIRAFNATVGVFSTDKSRALIIPTKYWGQIGKFMEDNNIIVKFYR